jgi:hypothetical protein
VTVLAGPVAVAGGFAGVLRSVTVVVTLTEYTNGRGAAGKLIDKERIPLAEVPGERNIVPVLATQGPGGDAGGVIRVTVIVQI